jgi:hypothetical protein
LRRARPSAEPAGERPRHRWWRGPPSRDPQPLGELLEALRRDHRELGPTPPASRPNRPPPRPGGPKPATAPSTPARACKPCPAGDGPGKSTARSPKAPPDTPTRRSPEPESRPASRRGPGCGSHRTCRRSPDETPGCPPPARNGCPGAVAPPVPAEAPPRPAPPTTALHLPRSRVTSVVRGRGGGSPPAHSFAPRPCARTRIIPACWDERKGNLR